MKASLDPRRLLVHPLICGALVCGALLGGGGTALARDIAVVVHPEVPVDNLSFAELRKIMLGDRQFWPSGQKVTLVVAEPVDPGRTLLLEKVYKMSEPAFRQYWIAKVFRGEVTEGPKVVLSSEGIQELVTVMEGAIAFMDFDDVPAGLKVLKIDGKAPGEAGYPLQLE
jgi:ABC-type phosphate transport system substrate-binding protein